MQQPRRTTELLEVLGTVTKRQSSRQTQQRFTTAPSPLTGTAVKYLPKQSRTSRNSSQERASTNAFLTTNAGSVLNRRTPQKVTPLTKTPANRILFTAEKRGTATSSTTGGALHNDKKWVQEQSQRIMEYLEEVVSPGVIPGIGTDFFARGAAGLRQMSIKQFVGIINYFLQQISSNRLVVGTNHVEDIVSILQKLNYPYQVNKSWLKTPNTQHSFGNVIVLLDFFMDLVEPDSYCSGLEFQEPGDTTYNTASSFIGTLPKPDGEFLVQLFNDAEQGWDLWNERLMEEYSECEQKTCNSLIQKMCGLQTMQKLNDEIKRLKAKLSELEKYRPAVPKIDQDQLNAELKYTLSELQMANDDIESAGQQIKELEAKKQTIVDEMRSLGIAVHNLQKKVKEQKCKQIFMENFEDLIEEVGQLKHMHKIQESKFADLRNENHSQQVKLSRAKKRLADQVDEVNKSLRKICFSDINTEYGEDDLQLPLNPEQKHLEHVKSILLIIDKNLKNLIEEKEQKIQQYEQDISNIKENMNDNLLPKMQSIEEMLNAAEAANIQLHKYNEKIHAAQSDQIQQLDQEIKELEEQTATLHADITLKKDDVQRLIDLNEQTVSNAERRHKESVESRNVFLDKYETALGEAEDELEKLTEIVDKLNCNKHL